MINSTLDRFLSGISTQTIITLVNSIYQVVIFAVFSRLLTQEDFGLYATIGSVVFILIAIAESGIGSALIQSKNESDSYRNTAFTLCFILGILFSFISFIISPIVGSFVDSESVIVPIRILSVLIFLYSVQSFAVSMLRKHLNFKRVGVFKLISYFIASIVGLYLANNGFGIYSLIVLYIIDSLVYTILLFCSVPKPKLQINKENAKSILSFGGYLTLGVIVTSIFNQFDKFILSKLLGFQQVGAYNRPAGFLTNISNFFNSIFDSVLFPILSKFQDSMDSFRIILVKSVSLLSLLGIMLSFTLFFNSHLIIIVFFGDKWLDLLNVTHVLSFVSIFLLLNTLADCFFRSFNLVKSGFYIRLFGLFVCIVLLYWGASFGLIGVAFSVLFSNFLLTSFKFFYLCMFSNSNIIFIFVKILKAFIPSLPIVVVGLVFMNLPFNYANCIIQLILMGIIILTEFLFFPTFLGNEYVEMIYPKIELLKNKIFNKR